MTFDEAVYQGIKKALDRGQFASETDKNQIHTKGKKVIIAGKEYLSATTAALAFDAAPKHVLQYARELMKYPTGKPKDYSKRLGNVNGGKEVNDGDTVHPSIKSFAESHGFPVESVREDFRKGKPVQEIIKKYEKNRQKKMREVDGKCYETNQELADYLGVNRVTVSRLFKQYGDYQLVADHVRKHQMKNDNILEYRINDDQKLINIIDLSKEDVSKIITLKETSSVNVICPECLESRPVPVREIKKYAEANHTAPLCHKCAVRKTRSEETVYHGMRFPSQRTVLQFKGIANKAPQITALMKREGVAFENAVDFLVDQVLRIEKARLCGHREEFEIYYDDGYQIIDYIDREQCTLEGIILHNVRVDAKLPLKCPECGVRLNKPMQLRYLIDHKPVCPKCGDTTKDSHISTYDAVAFIAMASKVPCEYQKRVEVGRAVYHVDISIEVNGTMVAVEVDGNRFHKDENDARKTAALLNHGYSYVVRLREDNADGSLVSDIPEATNIHFANSPFQSKQHMKIFAEKLTEVVRIVDPNISDISRSDISEIKLHLPENITVEKVLDYASNVLK